MTVLKLMLITQADKLLHFHFTYTFHKICSNARRLCKHKPVATLGSFGSRALLTLKHTESWLLTSTWKTHFALIVDSGNGTDGQRRDHITIIIIDYNNGLFIFFFYFLAFWKGGYSYFTYMIFDLNFQ